jgi:hypothetical protein
MLISTSSGPIFRVLAWLISWLLISTFQIPAPYSSSPGGPAVSGDWLAPPKVPPNLALPATCLARKCRVPGRAPGIRSVSGTDFSDHTLPRLLLIDYPSSPPPNAWEMKASGSPAELACDGLAGGGCVIPQTPTLLWVRLQRAPPPPPCSSMPIGSPVVESDPTGSDWHQPQHSRPPPPPPPRNCGFGSRWFCLLAVAILVGHP